MAHLQLALFWLFKLTWTAVEPFVCPLGFYPGAYVDGLFGKFVRREPFDLVRMLCDSGE